MSVGDVLLSPTRHWAILIKKLIEALKKVNALFMLHGISMNTGGGATKISNLGQGAIWYSKEMPSEIPPIVQLIQRESGESWENMYRVFNCGIGIDVIGEKDPLFANILQQVSEDCHIPLYRLGNCMRLSHDNKKNVVFLKTPYGHFVYD
jgi:phosphoribosylformylglycinamidine cyclo-ligase